MDNTTLDRLVRSFQKKVLKEMQKTAPGAQTGTYETKLFNNEMTIKITMWLWT
jgi:hypothetical protein